MMSLLPSSKLRAAIGERLRPANPLQDGPLDDDQFISAPISM